MKPRASNIELLENGRVVSLKKEADDWVSVVINSPFLNRNNFLVKLKCSEIVNTNDVCFGIRERDANKTNNLK